MQLSCLLEYVVGVLVDIAEQDLVMQLYSILTCSMVNRYKAGHVYSTKS